MNGDFTQMAMRVNAGKKEAFYRGGRGEGAEEEVYSTP